MFTDIEDIFESPYLLLDGASEALKTFQSSVSDFVQSQPGKFIADIDRPLPKTIP